MKRYCVSINKRFFWFETYEEAIKFKKEKEKLGFVAKLGKVIGV